MLANVPLRDAKPAIVVCPHCARHLMEVKDVQWAAMSLEFTFECTGCGTELKRAISGHEEVAAFTSRASTLLRDLQIFNFNPGQIGPGREPRMPDPRPVERRATDHQTPMPRYDGS